MSGWVPMDITTNVMEMMAQQQGITLPPDLTSSAPAVASRSANLTSTSSPAPPDPALDAQFRAAVDMESGLVSTRRRLITPAFVPKPEPEVIAEPDEEDLLYQTEEPVASIPVSTSEASAPNAGAQYMDESLDDEEDDVTAIPNQENEGSSSSDTGSLPAGESAPRTVTEQINHLSCFTATDAEPEVIPLLDGDIDEQMVESCEQEEDLPEDKKQFLQSSAGDSECQIPGLGSPVRTEDEPADPIVESVVEEMADETRVGEEEDDIRMNDESESGVTAFQMASSLFPTTSEPAANPVVKTEPVTEPSAGPSEASQESADQETDSRSGRITRSTSARVTTTSPVKSRPVDPAPASVIPPVKIRIVPASSGVVYQLSTKEPPAATVSPPTGKNRVMRKPSTTPEPTAHPILVEKKSKSGPSDQSSSGRKISPSASDARKKKTAVSSAPQAGPEPCLNCGRPSVANRMWDNEYCSQECVLFYVQSVFRQMFPSSHKGQEQQTKDRTPSHPTTSLKSGS